jgi:sugar-specific transcriptional regulator TrmB
MYFFDMRQAESQIQQVCYTASINSFVLENDVDDIADIIDESKGCLDEYLAEIKRMLDEMRQDLTDGNIPDSFDINKFKELNEILENCLENAADDICKYVVNSLNTSFKIEQDTDESPLTSFPDFALDENVLEDFESETPSLTGAREYASGIGDSAEVGTNETANIIIIPRDSYDQEIGGDFSEKIVIEIVSDETGSARVVDVDGKQVIKSGEQYIAKIAADSPGAVKIKGKICDRVIQAVTYAGAESDVEEGTESEIDCVPDTASELETASPSLGALIKVDRLLTIFFVKKSSVALAQNNDGADLAHTEPREFGTSLE